MYRDDLAATHARVEQLQRELASTSSQRNQDQKRIAQLSAQLASMQQALARAGGERQAYQIQSYIYPSRGGTILALGILSLVVCSVMGPIAWAMGNEEMRRIESGQAPEDGRSNATAGRICGIIASVMLMLGGMLFLMLLAMAR